MSIKDLMITDQNVQSTYVQSQPDRLTGTAQQNKAVFDAFPQLIRQRFNALLEALAGAGAAGEIPVGPIEGVTAENVQQALEAIQQNLTAYINRIKSAVGASEVGVSTISGMNAQNVQKALEELRTAIDNIVSGIIPGGSITPDMLVGPIPPEKGGTGATTAQTALAALGAGVRPNLLDNAYFVGGGTGWGIFPVNQRGKTRYSYPEYRNVFDRWTIADGQAVIELVEDGIIIRDGKTSGGAVITFMQTLPRVLNDDVFTMSCVVTEIIGTWFFASNSFKAVDIPIAVGINEGIVPKENAVLKGKYFYFFKTSSGADDYIKVRAVKIERGEGQTLAYQDDEGFIHLLPQPDSNYASQLLRCQQYFQLYSSPEMRPEKAIDCRPVMRIDPTPGTLQIDEQTYYYNSAEL